MDTTQPPRQPPKIKFRVLIIGRANAGKTSILQRVCDTTESPVVYRRMDFNDSDSESEEHLEQIQLDPSTERGEHRIEDEITFSNHDGYIFHDSRGFESGGADELEIVQNFVQQKSGERRLADRLHAIWYCIPMDDVRPELDLKYFKDICPDPNVPVIGVFTKYDQFKLDVEMDLEDGNMDELETHETRFDKHYLCHLGGARFVQLERMNQPDGCCKNLIEETAQALKYDVVVLMLLAVQRSNLQLSVMLAVNHMYPKLLVSSTAKEIVKICLSRFPYIGLLSLFDFSLSSFLDLSHNFLSHNFLDDNNSDLVTFILSMSTMKQFSSGNSGYHLMTAVILILKHATNLLLSGLGSKSALTQAELDLQKLNIFLKITQNLTAPPQQYSVQNFVDFIMGVSL